MRSVFNQNILIRIFSHPSVEMGGLCSKANIAILEKDAISAVKKVIADPAVVAAVEKAAEELIADVKADVKAKEAKAEEPKAEDAKTADTKLNTVV